MNRLLALVLTGLALLTGGPVQAATYGQHIEFGPYFVSGALAAGAKVYHYSAGTETLRNCWSDRAKTTTVAQPLVADSQGVASAFCDGVYQFVVKSSAGTTLYSFDNVAVADQTQTTTGEGAALASASTLILGTDGDFFHVTGTNAISALSGTQTQVVLTFDSALTLTHSGTLILNSAVSYTTTAGAVVGFVNEGGGVWREIFRSMLRPIVTGADGTVLLSRAASTGGFGTYAAVLNRVIYGLTYENGTDATNDVNINTGGAMDATGAYWMTLATALGKQSDVAWAVGGTTGTPLGCLDTGAVGNSDYYLWLIARSDTGVVDALCSLSSTAPTMPASYDFKRLFGWFKRTGGTVVAFHTYETEGGGIDMLWDSPTLDVNLANTLTTTRRTDAVKVPLNFSVIANLNTVISDGVTTQVYIYCPDLTDLAPSATATPLGNQLTTNVAGFTLGLSVRTSATGTIAARANTATVDLYAVTTLGFTWARRN